ncbi:MAG: hypothetical protein SGJ04_07030 [Bacteroidota bacterium]|nr:hypothetical protein [Bacteroidota bacterium]
MNILEYQIVRLKKNIDSLISQLHTVRLENVSLREKTLELEKNISEKTLINIPLKNELNLSKSKSLSDGNSERLKFVEHQMTNYIDEMNEYLDELEIKTAMNEKASIRHD